MGKAVIHAAEANDSLRILAGVDINADAIAPAYSFPVYENISEFPQKADVIIDFSHHSALPSILSYATKTNTPVVVCTTGHIDEEKALMDSAACEVAVFSSGNMSIGINLLMELAKLAENRAREHAQNLIKMMYHRKAMRKEAGMGMREGKEDAGPL